MAGVSVSVATASTVICLRRRPNPANNQRLYAADLLEGFRDRFFGDDIEFQFNSGWEVLLGQNEVKNWLKSTKEKTKIMRYPGEFKLAGGTVDDGETLLEAARRELREEFLDAAELPLPEDATLRPFSIKQTRPVQGRSYLMCNFVALESENKWLKELDTDIINHALEVRRQRHLEAVSSGRFWSLSKAEKESLAPEVREVKWVSLADSIMMSLSSLQTPVRHVNSFQKSEYERYKIHMRDPMYMTALTLMEVEAYPDEKSIMSEHSHDIDLMERITKVQYIFEGEKVEDTVAKSSGVPMSLKEIARARDVRRRGTALQSETHGNETIPSRI
eukprot:m.96097 g.96097  ORF g.96097 m.96097 type:complete len:332 (+) comp13528_c0_seq1:153-1148(+)